MRFNCAPLAATLALATAASAFQNPYDPDYSIRDFSTAYGSVHIEWTGDGVPEIAGATDASAFFGWGYAMSVDRFFEMEIARRFLRGTTAELLGEGDGSKSAPLTTDIAARRLRLMDFATMSEVSLNAVHPEQMSLVQAFSDGVNLYLTEKLGPISTWTSNAPAFRANLESVDELFITNPLDPDRFAPWIPMDTILAQWRISESPSTNLKDRLKVRKEYDALIASGSTPEEALDEVMGSAVVDEQAMTVQQSDVSQADQDALTSYAISHGWGGLPSSKLPFVVAPSAPHPKFSHAFAIGGSRTTTGRGVMLGMPQLPVSRMLFEASVKGATFTSRGISFAGVPGYMVGFNNDVAWSVTGAGGSTKLSLRLNKPDDDHYEFENTIYPIVKIPDTIQIREPYTPGTAPTWKTQAITVSWASQVKHSNASDPNGEQTVRRGVPILTDQQNAQFVPNNSHIGMLSFHYFDNTRESVISYIDMLRANSVAEFDSALQLYSTPSVTVVAADKDGNAGFWFAKPVLLHSSDIAIAPLGAFGLQECLTTSDLPSDLIPMEFLPHVTNPLNQTTPGVRSNLEGIILTGNSGAVGSWYPIPVYSGNGDTMRSWRFRQLLSTKGPDDLWSPEELLGFNYDNVDPFRLAGVRAALYQDANYGAELGVEADTLLKEIKNTLYAPDQGLNWAEAGGHMHSEHPLLPVLGYIGSSFRSESYPALTAIYGQTQSGQTQLYQSLENAMANNRNLYKYHASDAADAEVKQFLNEILGNAWVRASLGENNLNDSSTTFLPYTGAVSTWKNQYLQRTFNGSENGGKKTSGAKFVVKFHEEFHPFGSLDPTKDIKSNVLSNPKYGIGAQAFNIYSQWVHFRWHDMSVPIGLAINAHVAFNIGNSLHPSSAFFANAKAMWERDRLGFDLDSTQADPTKYTRSAPLQ